eukprot:3274953-Ditylum_brightwellii.AAC.1
MQLQKASICSSPPMHRTLPTTRAEITISMSNNNNRIEAQSIKKTNQSFKYADRQSTHCTATFESITTGVFICLRRLSSREEDRGKQRTDKDYPEHVEALFIADVAPETCFPTFGEVWKDDDERKEIGQRSNRAHRNQ